jgi:hypothetical protein
VDAAFKEEAFSFSFFFWEQTRLRLTRGSFEFCRKNVKVGLVEGVLKKN